MDMFIEKIVKRRKSLMELAGTALIVVLVFVVCFLVFLYIPSFSLILVAGIIYLAYFLISRRNLEFEYAVTNGDLDIDKIINQKSRKRVFSANAKDFEVAARVKSDKYTNEIKECKNVKDFTSHMENAENWFIYMRKEGSQIVVLFEPSQQMIDNFFTFNPRKVFRY
jgi:hypothetical protein